MELHELIRSKRFDSETHHKLLEFARGNNIVEDLLDYILETKKAVVTDVDEYVNQINKLEETIGELKITISHKDIELSELSEIHDTDSKKLEVSSKSLDEFIKKTKSEHNRYPSIDEAWSESENRFLKV